MRGIFRGWGTWGDRDENGNYYVDKNGVPSKQATCRAEPAVPIWTEWSDYSCSGSCPEDSFQKRTRKCIDESTNEELSASQCDGESEEIAAKCLNVDFEEPFVEPITRIELARGLTSIPSSCPEDCLKEPAFPSPIEGDPRGCNKCIDRQVCTTGRTPGLLNRQYCPKCSEDTYGRGRKAMMHFNTGDWCHFPSFGMGWPDQHMENGDHVQMGVECENDWNYSDHSLAKKGDTCKLVCKNLSGNSNKYTPVIDKYNSFQCLSPIPIFAFQEEKCNKNLMPDEPDVYDDCYKDWVTKGLNMGSQSPYENYLAA